MLPKGANSDLGSYSGARKVAVFLNGREIFLGELKKPTQAMAGLSAFEHAELVQELTTEMSILSSNSNSGSPTVQKSEPLMKQPDKVSLKPQTFTRLVGGSSTGHLGALVSNPGIKVVGRTTITSIGSEEDDSKRDTLGKQSVGGMAPSTESRDRDDMAVGGRSLSKQSKSSFESKKHHPRVANSSAKLMFDLAGNKLSAANTNLLPGVPFPNKMIFEEKFAPARYRESSEGVSARKDPIRPMSGFTTLQTVRSNRNLPTKPRADLFAQNLHEFHNLVRDNATFALPDRPSGSTLYITFYTNWGDPDHLGLNGLEFFDSSGLRVQFQKPQESISVASAQTASVHHSPEYLMRLIRPEVWRRNHDQLFMTKLEDGNPLQLKIKLKGSVSLTFIRVWNYDKSKVHASRGVRHMSIVLDKNLIFFGEIKKSSGDRSKFLEDAEYISFIPESNRSADQGFAADWVNTITEADYNPPQSEYNEVSRTTDLSSLVRGNSASRDPSESGRGTASSASGSPRARGSLKGECRNSNLQAGWTGLNMLDRKPLHRNTASGYEFSLVPTLVADEPSTSTTRLGRYYLEFVFLDAWKEAAVFGLKAIELFGRQSG